MTYFCPNCEKDVAEPDKYAIADPELEGERWFQPTICYCPDCGVEIVESWECPIHGTDAPDGYGNCAKC